jgi:hypothetical protein
MQYLDVQMMSETSIEVMISEPWVNTTCRGTMDRLALVGSGG